MDLPTFCGLVLSALLAAESIVLSLFGGLLGVYARYKTTKGFESAPLIPLLKRISIYTCVLLVAVVIAIFATLGMMMPYCTPTQCAYLVLLGVISVLLVVPAFWITKAMK